MDGIINKISMAVLILVFVTMTYVIFMLFWPFQTIVVESPCKVITPVVKAGDRVYYEFNYKKLANRGTILSKQLVNNTIIFYPIEQSNIESGPGEILKIVSVCVPIYAPPGKYKLFVTAVYRISPIRNITKRWETEEFEVVKK